MIANRVWYLKVFAINERARINGSPCADREGANPG